MRLPSYVSGSWYEAADGFSDIRSAVDDRIVAQISAAGLDVGRAFTYARNAGESLRSLTFAQRAGLLREVAGVLADVKATLVELSYDTGSTSADHAFDIDGGIGTLAALASRARRELPDERFILDGAFEPLSKRGGFGGRHFLVPRAGVALFINAYNFPVWGFLEKFAPAFLAGVPAIVKPASATAQVTHAALKAIVDSKLLPEGALQFIAGSPPDLLDYLTGQDLVSFTGSLETSLALRAHPVIARESVRFIAERDSLNAAVLGRDAGPGSPEFAVFVSEVVREMTVKAGQKCTAIRRAFVPRRFYDAAAAAISEHLANIGPAMGALVSRAQRDSVHAAVATLREGCDVLFGDADAPIDRARAGAFYSPVLLGTRTPHAARVMHDVEAFGPVATLAAYDGTADAIALVNASSGSLVASIYSYDAAEIGELVAGIAPYHGRILIADRDCSHESTGHGAPPPYLVHGGPGRAGGGEELGGLRALGAYLQRVAVQGSPTRLSGLGNEWIATAAALPATVHPFRIGFDELEIGTQLQTGSRTISLDDIERFAQFTGDTFYAHMDEAAARANPFFGGRVAHGYLLLSFAAGLFVEPAPGPVLANYGLESLRFSKPVKPGDSIAVRLTVKSKTARKPEYGEVRWAVEIRNHEGELVAQYDLLTMNARDPRTHAVDGAIAAEHAPA